MSKQILLIEDDPDLAELISDYLTMNYYDVHHAGLGQEGLDILDTKERDIDLVVLDLMLPDMDGMQVCQKVRGNKNNMTNKVPIIMLTAKGDTTDRVLGLEMGADDYICKPFSPKELVARVQAVLRRLERKAEPEQNDLFRIDKAQQRIWYQQKALTLTPTEFRLLELFLEHLGQVYSRAQLLDHINPDSFDVADRVIDSHIKNLRRKITEAAETGNRHEWIQAVYGVGYRFEYPDE